MDRGQEQAIPRKGSQKKQSSLVISCVLTIPHPSESLYLVLAVLWEVENILYSWWKYKLIQLPRKESRNI